MQATKTKPSYKGKAIIADRIIDPRFVNTQGKFSVQAQSVWKKRTNSK